MKLSYETQDFNRVFQQQRVHFKLKRRKFVESERYHLNIENQSGESVQISMRTFIKIIKAEHVYLSLLIT